MAYSVPGPNTLITITKPLISGDVIGTTLIGVTGLKTFVPTTTSFIVTATGGTGPLFSVGITGPSYNDISGTIVASTNVGQVRNQTVSTGTTVPPGSSIYVNVSSVSGVGAGYKMTVSIVGYYI